MMKDVIININSSQTDDNDDNSLELTTIGRYGIRDGEYFITYDESHLLGVNNVKTILFIKSDNSVVLQRTGDIDSRLVIVKEKRNICYYSMPEGVMAIGIYGEIVENRLTDSGGEISLQYTIDSNFNFISRNTVNISVREVNKDVNTCS